MRTRLALTLTAALTLAGLPGCAARPVPPWTAPVRPAADATLQADLDRILEDPVFDRAVVGVHVESLQDGRVVYSRNAAMRMMPASSLKLVTAAVAADRLGWDHRFETRLDAIGPIVDGVLRGDLVVVGTGDPTITSQNLVTAALFEEWAGVLQLAGINRIAGRLIGDDNAFVDEPLGAGWAWDYLAAAYAAPSGALSYNENVALIRITPGIREGAPADIGIGPPGHGLTIVNLVTTASTTTPVSLTLERLPGSHALTVRGHVPAGGVPQVRMTPVPNPTRFFLDGFGLALAGRGITIDDDVWDIDDLGRPPAGGDRRTLATRRSPTLSAIIGQMLKISQNFYAEILLKALGRTRGLEGGSAELGRTVILETLGQWGVPTEALVMYDGSGLSRYNYAAPELLVAVLRHVWGDEKLRGPFAAALPVGGHDGTLQGRMSGLLRRRIQAKTGTIANVRALAGFAETAAGEKLVFALIANHFTAPSTSVDAVMDRVLERLVR